MGIVINGINAVSIIQICNALINNVSQRFVQQMQIALPDLTVLIEYVNQHLERIQV